MFTLNSLAADGFTWQSARSLALASKLSCENKSIVRNVALNSFPTKASVLVIFQFLTTI
jgi:hypothetical protein